MRVLIVGAGAIGSFFGHRLASAGHAVTLVCRAPWVKAIQSQGLGLEEKNRVLFQTNLTAVPNVADVTGNAFDLLVCTTKVYDTAQAMHQVARSAIGRVPLLLLQNGVGGEEIAAGALPQAPRLAGVITLPVKVLSPGLIRLAATRGGIGLAAASPGAQVDDLVATLRQADFGEIRSYVDYRAMRWSKLLLNMLGNAVPTILDTPPDKIYGQRRLFDLEQAAFCEALAVMRALGLKSVRLPGYPVPLLAWGMSRLPATVLHPLFRRFIVGGRGGKMPSLHLDLLKGKQKSEVDFLNGAVAGHARRIQLGAPMNHALHSTLQAIVSGDLPWAEFQGQPQKLLARVGWPA